MCIRDRNDTALVCYIFNTHQLILIFLAGNNYGVCAIISLFNFSCPFAIISLICCDITKAKTTHFWRYWSLLNMPFTEKRKIFINNLFDLKVCSGKHLVREFPSKSWNVGLVYQLLQNLRVTGLVDRCSSSTRCCNTRPADNIDLVDEVVLHNNRQAKNNICTLCGLTVYKRIIKIGW